MLNGEIDVDAWLSGNDDRCHFATASYNFMHS